MRKLGLALIFLVSHVALSYAQCENKNTSWIAERDGTRYQISGSHGLSYGSAVAIEGFQDTRRLWVAKGTITCSNGASICYLLVDRGTDAPDTGPIGVVLETIDENEDDMPEWAILASFGQTMWPYGLRAEWAEAAPVENRSPIFPPNIYRLKHCRVDNSIAVPDGAENSQSIIGWTTYYNPRFGYQIEIPPTFSEVIEPANGDGGISRSLEGNAELSVWGHHIITGDFRTEIESRIASSEQQGWKISYKRRTDHWASWSGSKGNRVFYQRAIPLCDNQAAQFRLEYDRAALRPFDPIVERLVGTFTFDSDCRKSSSRVEVSPTWQVRSTGVYALDDDSRSIELGGTFARSNLDRFLGDVDANIIQTEGEDCSICYYITLKDGGVIFIDSDGQTIDHIRAYGPAFVDSEGTAQGTKSSKGDKLICIENALMLEEECREKITRGVRWIFQEGSSCRYNSRTPIYEDLEIITFNGCESIIGFAINNWD
ncbi:MAG: hypothetical protein K5863_17325 [Nitratireductor sp.]|uniref:hypothetical protein n=1 Tax=Nitratireductor sp. TaxID=1872084 RepID=UPI002611909D|nr:hypothetical protein [Nitratireductor sp.]MCV0351842.1 hypothetical protein [Nitratireductor sp.]